MEQQKLIMIIKPHAEGIPQSVPLPLYESHNIADVVLVDGTECSLFLGLSQDHVQKLQERSLDTNDTAVQELTSDRKRFGEGSYEAWYKKGRVPFALVEKETQNLAALVWFGKEGLHDEEGDWHTIAYRSYEPYRGKKMMKPLTQHVFDIYKTYYPSAHFWAGIDAKNPASAGLALALGFEESATHSNKGDGKLVMIKK